MYSASSSPFSRSPGAVKLSRYHTGPLLPGRLTRPVVGQVDQRCGLRRSGSSRLSDTTAWAAWMCTVCASGVGRGQPQQAQAQQQVQAMAQPLRDVPRAEGRAAG